MEVSGDKTGCGSGRTFVYHLEKAWRTEEALDEWKREVVFVFIGNCREATQISKELVLPKLLITLVSSLMNFRKAVGLISAKHLTKCSIIF